MAVSIVNDNRKDYQLFIGTFFLGLEDADYDHGTKKPQKVVLILLDIQQYICSWLCSRNIFSI
jgi:hypothetical protein